MSTEELIIQTDEQLLRIDEVAALTTLSKSCINLWVAQGRFPRPSSLSKTLKVWRLRDIRAWSNSLFSDAGGGHE
ncbi:AlpA family phage regulatory protein [Polynucleobacter sp. 31A-FELB]|jgi:predicted DNA-binding transcriptional regulator AlpA|uniref:helix-turn-helix transcriptional regulator n=1 Tax=Polynucleobacter sp. 31A-FELB TaxID=2689096 RepID=UPI001C0CBA5F|nr:AlpA family phage regulatory protein [Polynucleobacter sp. 31A-FELB]MBU3588028.1 AlpA family phage regulatory protein [Polynucleobacter sp. 31A-FELB]